MDILLQNITKKFNQNIVLNNISIVFPEGRLSCIMGASGSGKTTLANIMMGLIKKDSGTILGMEGKKIAAVFQENRLIEHWDAIRNVRLVCDKSITETKIEQEFKEVGLDDYRNKSVSSLSGGMKRRVSLVRAILAKSDIMILDEPFKELDEELKFKVIDYVIKNTEGKTVIIITHDREEVIRLGGNVILLK